MTIERKAPLILPPAFALAVHRRCTGMVTDPVLPGSGGFPLVSAVTSLIIPAGSTSGKHALALLPSADLRPITVDLLVQL